MWRRPAGCQAKQACETLKCPPFVSPDLFQIFRETYIRDATTKVMDWRVYFSTGK